MFHQMHSESFQVEKLLQPEFRTRPHVDVAHPMGAGGRWLGARLCREPRAFCPQ